MKSSIWEQVRRWLPRKLYQAKSKTAVWRWDWRIWSRMRCLLTFRKPSYFLAIIFCQKINWFIDGKIIIVKYFKNWKLLIDGTKQKMDKGENWKRRLSRFSSHYLRSLFLCRPRTSLELSVLWATVPRHCLHLIKSTSRYNNTHKTDKCQTQTVHVHLKKKCCTPHILLRFGTRSLNERKNVEKLWTNQNLQRHFSPLVRWEFNSLQLLTCTYCHVFWAGRFVKNGVSL